MIAILIRPERRREEKERVREERERGGKERIEFREWLKGQRTEHEVV
jgi:hypothetical protein